MQPVLIEQNKEDVDIFANNNNQNHQPQNKQPDKLEDYDAITNANCSPSPTFSRKHTRYNQVQNLNPKTKDNDMNVTATEIEDSSGKLKKADHVINLRQYPPAAAKDHLEIEDIDDYNSGRGSSNR